jgi:hypothetical protein
MDAASLSYLKARAMWLPHAGMAFTNYALLSFKESFHLTPRSLTDMLAAIPSASTANHRTRYFWIAATMFPTECLSASDRSPAVLGPAGMMGTIFTPFTVAVLDSLEALSSLEMAGTFLAESAIIKTLSLKSNTTTFMSFAIIAQKTIVTNYAWLPAGLDAASMTLSIRSPSIVEVLNGVEALSSIEMAVTGLTVLAMAKTFSRHIRFPHLWLSKYGIR